jgi:hypothetical protein
MYVKVLAKLEGLKERFDVVKYGSLPYDAGLNPKP